MKEKITYEKWIKMTEEEKQAAIKHFKQVITKAEDEALEKKLADARKLYKSPHTFPKHL